MTVGGTPDPEPRMNGAPSPGSRGGGAFGLSAALLLVVSVGMLRLPLLDYLGYEYAAAIALFLPLVPGLFLVRVFRRRPRDPSAPILARAMLLLAVPIAAGWLNGFLVKNCAPGAGIGYFLLIPAVTMVWVVSLARFCAAFFRRPAAWYWAFVVVVLLHPLLLGYATPRIDSYNFIYGYFPGFTYDEDLSVTSTLVAFRGVTLLCAVFFFAAGAFASARRAGEGPASPPADRPSAARLLAMVVSERRWGIILPLLLLVAAWFLRLEMGFESTAGSIRRELGSVAETAHFRICYDSTDIPADEIRRVAAEHEFRFSQVVEALGVESDVTITSYIYPDTDTKRRLMGAGGTDIAKPWRGEIHLDGDSWKSTLKHELVHVLAGQFGMPVIRANTNIALVEGLAMALSPSFGNHTLSEYSAAMVRFGIVEDPASLIRTTGFAFQSSAVSYVLMGSFCGHVIGKYGIDSFRKWYGGESPESSFGVDAGTLAASWTAALARITVPDSWRPHVEYWFRRPSIFAKECARYVANLNREGYRSLGKKEYRDAKDAFGEALAESWNTPSFSGYVRALLSAGEYGEVVRLFEVEMQDTARRKSLTAAGFVFGDALMMRGDHLLAGMVFRDLYNLHLSPPADEAAALRLAVLSDWRIRDPLAPWFAGRMSDTAALEALEGFRGSPVDTVAGYLRMRLLYGRKEYQAILPDLVRFGAPFAWPELNAAVATLQGETFFRLGEFLAAASFHERALAFVEGEAGAERVRDRVARAQWFNREWAGMVLRPGDR